MDRGVVASALTLVCPICTGTGGLTYGATTKPCGRCGGEGYVEDPQARVARVERALHREAAGVQPLPLEDHNGLDRVLDVCTATPDGGDPELGARVDTDRGDEVAVAEVPEVESPVEEVPHDSVILEADMSTPPPLLYDLPVNSDALPAFCFICGPAGTGKTFWAKALAAQDPEGVVLAATTGIAAVNLGEGTTINSLLKFFNTQSLTEAFTGGWLESQLKRLRGAGLRRIVLDETSMLDGDQLTILSRALDNVNQDRGGDDAELGLILIGDFAQLPPVKAPFAFESAEWGRYAEATYGLTTIRRQAERDFIEALQAVRRGDAKKALEFFGDRLEQLTHPHFDGTTILAKNDAVDKYNQLRLDKVPGAAIQFGSQRWGKLRPEWGGPPKAAYEWGVPEVLKLKIGALVMILANRNVAEKGEPPSYLYVNGDLGQVMEQDHGCATVVLQRTGEEIQVVPITRENVIPLEVGRRKALKAEGHPERVSANGKSEVIGACSYMPLRLAYASTVHKSQGLSLSAVQTSIRDHFFTQPGMMYTALSRCRTAEGLRIVGNPETFRIRCTVNPKVTPWL